MSINDGINRDPFIEEIIEPIRMDLKYMTGFKHLFKIAALLDYLMNDDFAKEIESHGTGLPGYRRALAEKVQSIK